MAAAAAAAAASSSASGTKGAANLIGKKQLLAWASEVCGVEVAKYDDLRDGLVPLMIFFRALFPHGVSAEYAAHMRAELGMTSLQRNSRQNWTVLQQLLRSGGVPANVWDRRGVASAHPKACYNFLVMAMFLAKLKQDAKDFSVDFALPIEVDLSTFLQSPRSLDVVHRSNSVRPVPSSAAAQSGGGGGGGVPQNVGSGYESADSLGGGGFAAGSSADVTPIGTPRIGAMLPPPPPSQQQRRAASRSPPRAAAGSGLYADAASVDTTIFVSPASVARRSSPPRGGGGAAASSNVGGIRTITQISNSGWRYGLDVSELGEAVVQRLRADNSRLRDALTVTEEHSAATQRSCEEQLRFAPSSCRSSRPRRRCTACRPRRRPRCRQR